MYREPLKDIENVNIVFSDGGIGDCLARLPVIYYINKFHPQVKIHLWIPDFFLDLARKSLSEDVIIRGFSEKEHYNETFVTRSFISTQYNNLAVHLVDHAFHVIVGKDVEVEHKNYLKIRLNNVSINKFNLPKKYVVVTTGFTAVVREWLANIVNEVTKYIKDKNYKIVFLGKTETSNGNDYTIKGEFKEEIDFSIGMNLIDKTTLVESAKIIQNSVGIVGLDNGLLHLAGCTDIPIVGAYTTVEPKYRLPYRHDQLGWNCYPITPPQSLACRFCQSNMTFAFNHDFRTCFYKERKEDTEIQCVKQITANSYIKELEKIL